MRAVQRLGAAALASLALATAAQATLSVSLVPVPVNSGSGLTNVRTFDLKVTQTGEKWNVANLQLTVGGASSQGLTGGLFDNGNSDIYQSAHSAATDPLSYDTYV